MNKQLRWLGVFSLVAFLAYSGVGFEYAHKGKQIDAYEILKSRASESDLSFLSVTEQGPSDSRQFSCYAWYNYNDTGHTRQQLLQQPYDKDYYETTINEITYGMLFNNRAKHEPGFIVADKKNGVSSLADGALRRIPNTTVDTASMHYYRTDPNGARLFTQLACFLE